jgi:acetate CoA/acetoacetate CoA-transferase alpha subunit
LEVELVPQGTLAERIRAAGFGLGAVVTPTGVGTVVAEGKRTLEIDGRTFLVELPLHADYALVNARQSDHIGNLAYALTARNFNPLIAMAAEVVMAEAQEIVPVGVIPPDAVMTPSVVVTYIIAKESVHG